MLFHSVQFMVFLCAALVAYWAVHKRRLPRLVVLFAASVVFYSAWMPLPLLLFAALAFVMWQAASGIRRAESDRGKKIWVSAAVTIFLITLGIFKYANLFYSTAIDLARLLGKDVAFHRLDWIFPLGISFGVFQAIHYVVDVYRGHITERYGYWKTLLYLLFFPHLIAGPIVRAPFLLARFDEVPSVTKEEGARAIYRIATGVAKKLLLADLLSVGIVDPVFASPTIYTSTEVAVAVVAYTFQIYYDFSAYSDIAIGAAALFGFKFPENFNKPYVARNLFEFWNRWHMTLSTWLRDYLYFPLGGSREGKWKTLRNVMIVMVLGGLWHGAGWRFAVWGFVHGCGLWIVRLWWWTTGYERREPGPFAKDRERTEQPTRWRLGPMLGPVLGVALTFTYVVLSRVFFRSPDVSHAVTVFRQLFEGTVGVVNVHTPVWVALFFSALLHWLPPQLYERSARAFVWLPAPARAVMLVVLIVGVRQIASFEARPYIYFQF
jgi:D-alanyl-lipoteichoic acid acyltransferase DltB (MBOAT superfamily)